MIDLTEEVTRSEVKADKDSGDLVRVNEWIEPNLASCSSSFNGNQQAIDEEQ